MDTKFTIHKPEWVLEFQKFVTRGNVVDMAVGIIIGAAFTAIVSSLVKDVMTPCIGLLTGGIDFSNIFITLKGPVLPTLAEAEKAGAVTINVGVFLNAVIQFAIVAFAVFWLVKLVSSIYRKQEAAAEPTASETLLMEIRDLLAGKGEAKNEGR